MELNKNDKIEITIDALTSEGSGVGRYNGLAVFVRGTVPQDRIIAHIIKRSKNYAIGIIDKIILPSPSRIESDCPYSERCGGCSFRHMTYEEELKYKISRVQNAIERIGRLDAKVNEIVKADDIRAYRNKAQYPVRICGGELYAGFYAYKSHRIIPCADCALEPAEFEQGLCAFGEWVKAANVSSYDEKSCKGLLRHIYFRKGSDTGEIMACAVINGKSIPQGELLISLLKQKVNGLKSVVININTEKTNVILGSENITIWGNDYISDRLLGKTYIISPNSFYQVNHKQCEKLYKKVIETAALKGGETLIDLYCGVGTIGLSMADSVKKLYGIEIVPEAVKNAKVNARLNNIENAEFICADAPQGAQLLKERGIKPDVVILDPPRKGCGKGLINTVIGMAPEKIIYVSCDSATLARDMAIFSENGFAPGRIAAVDMFPRTPHVETVVLMSRVEK